jgi:hypothetical protein
MRMRMKMNKDQLYLVCLVEEASEIIDVLASIQKRAAKVLRFGFEECQEGQDDDNETRLADEIWDFEFLISQLVGRGRLSRLTREPDAILTKEKEAKFERFLNLSKEMGILEKEKDE